jgi:hypothetical protein
MGEHTFDYAGLVDERCSRTEWLEAAREEALREHRRWRVRELAIIRVLDERGRVDDSMAVEDGVSVRHVQETRQTARRLDELPEIARAAHDGELSEAQLAAVARLAESDVVRNSAHVEAPSGPDRYFVVHVPPDGPAEIAGIPLPDETVEALRASTKIEPVLVDDAGVPLTRLAANQARAKDKAA